MYSYYRIFYIYLLNYVRSRFFLWIYHACMRWKWQFTWNNIHIYYTVCIKYSIVHFAFTNVHCTLYIYNWTHSNDNNRPRSWGAPWYVGQKHPLSSLWLGRRDALGWGEHTWSPSSPLPVLLLPLLPWWHGRNMRGQRCPGKSHPRWEASHFFRGPPLCHLDAFLSARWWPDWLQTVDPDHREEAAITYLFQRLSVPVQQGNCASVMGTTGQLDSGLFY